MSYDNTSLQQGTSPVQTQGGGSEALLLPSDMLRDNPKAMMKYYQTHKQYNPFLNVLKTLGFSEGMQYPFVEHYENPRPRHTFKVGAVVTAASGAGDEIVISLAAEDMYTRDGSLGYGSRPRKGETVIFSDRNEYRIVDKDTTTVPATHRLTLKPIDSSVNPNTAIIVGAKAFIVGPIKGEATGQVKGMQPRYYKYQNTFVIVDETNLDSGTFLTNKAPFAPVPGKPGYYYVKGIEDADIRHERSKSMRAIFGRTMDNASDYSEKLGMTVDIKGTEGLLQFAQTNGLDDTFANLGAYTIDEFYALASHYKELQVGTNEFMVAQGHKMNNTTDKLLKDYIDNSFVEYVGNKYMSAGLKAAGMSPAEMFVTVGFKGLNVANTNFLFFGLGELDDADVNATGARYNEMQIIAPLGFFQDKKANKLTPIMGYAYRSNPEIGYSRENEIWKNGGAGPKEVVKSSEFDVMETFIRSEFATHFSNGGHFVVQRSLA